MGVFFVIGELFEKVELVRAAPVAGMWVPVSPSDSPFVRRLAILSREFAAGFPCAWLVVAAATEYDRGMEALMAGSAATVAKDLASHAVLVEEFRQVADLVKGLTCLPSELPPAVLARLSALVEVSSERFVRASGMTDKVRGVALGGLSVEQVIASDKRLTLAVARQAPPRRHGGFVR